MNKKLEGRDLVREKIRIRDKHTCQHCGKKWEQNTRRLDVFNTFGPDRQYNVDEKKLISLCKSCSLKAVYHRKQNFLKTSEEEIKENKRPLRRYQDYLEEYRRKLIMIGK